VEDGTTTTATATALVAVAVAWAAMSVTWPICIVCKQLLLFLYINPCCL